MADLLLPLLSIAGGLVILVAGGEALVRGASALASLLRMSPLVIGLTVVAFGTSAPELAVSVQAAYGGNGDLAAGNLVGSNIANVLLILGISALIAPLVVASKLVRIDVPLVIGASVLFLLLGLDGAIGRWDGALLFGLLVVYIVWSVREARSESQTIQDELSGASHKSDAPPRPLAFQLLLILAGLGLLVLGARLLVGGAVDVARFLGVSELVIGLTIVAVGTSLPELVTSILAAVRGERDLAVGNVIGSNLFNILGVLGVASLVAPAGIPISPAALALDIPIMIAAAVACLPIFLTGHRIARWEGGLFFFYYIAYLAYLVLDATEHASTEGFTLVMTTFVIPLTVLTLGLGAVRALRERSAGLG